jgi:hypothetical protein
VATAIRLPPRSAITGVFRGLQMDCLRHCHLRDEEAKLRKAKKPLHRKMGLRSLSTGEAITVDSTESFAFNASGTRIAMKRYAPENEGRGRDKGHDELDTPKPGATLVVRDLASGRDTTFGNVAEYAWQGAASCCDDHQRGGKSGNGIQIFDPATGALRVLDSAPASYSGIAVAQGRRRSGRASIEDRCDARRPDPGDPAGPDSATTPARHSASIRRTPMVPV